MKYDFIFAGAGLASLMILKKMIEDPIFSNSRILLLDPNKKNSNDRTWCFWENDRGEFENLVTKSWSKAFFLNEEKKIDCLDNIFHYKMIEGKSFYDSIISLLKDFKNIDWNYEEVIAYQERNDEVIVSTKNTSYPGKIFFNSVYEESKATYNSKYPLIKQHFVGWFIKTEKNCFNANEAFFMDFSVAQKGNTRFMYVLPLTEKEALVEYTLFSKNVLEPEEYESEIRNYLSKKNIQDYTLIRKEKGIIPMTAYPFWKGNTTKVLQIGTAGGWTKASTGYTFKNVIKQSNRVHDFLKKEKVDFSKFIQPNRFHFYDNLFVSVLFYENNLGKKIFSNLFLKVKSNLILEFLEEKTNILQDLKVIMACPKIPFLKALLRWIKSFI